MKKDEAVEKINRQLESLKKLNVAKVSSPEFQKWRRDTRLTLQNVFGEDASHIKEFMNLRYTPSSYSTLDPDPAFRRALISGIESTKALLDSMIGEIQEYWDDKESNSKSIPEPVYNTQVIHTQSAAFLSLSSKDIWINIEEDYDISKKLFAKRINFVKDKFKRQVIFRDLEHAYILAQNGFSKPAVILAGSIIEELLRLYLEDKKVKPSNNNFDGYIKSCIDNRFLKSAIHRLTDSVRHFRNYVHLEKESEKKHTISKATAKGAVSSIFTIVNDFE